MTIIVEVTVEQSNEKKHSPVALITYKRPAAERRARVCLVPSCPKSQLLIVRIFLLVSLFNVDCLLTTVLLPTRLRLDRI